MNIKKLLTTTAIVLAMSTTAAIADLRDSFRGASGGIRVIDNIVTEGNTSTFTVTTTKKNGTKRTRTFTVTNNNGNFDVSGNGKQPFKDFLRDHAAKAQGITVEKTLTKNEIAFNAYIAYRVENTSNAKIAEAISRVKYKPENDWIQAAEDAGISVDYSEVESSLFANFDLTEGTAAESYTGNIYDFLDVKGLEQAHANGWTGEGSNILVRDFFQNDHYHGPVVEGLVKGTAPGANVIRSSEGTHIQSVENKSSIDILNLSQGQDLRVYFQDEVDFKERYMFWKLPRFAKLFENANIVKAAGNGGKNIFFDTVSYNNCVKAGNNITADSCTDLKSFYDLDGTNEANTDFIHKHSSFYKSFQDTKDRLIVVGATHDNETLADYSNAAGERAMNDFIVANGSCYAGNSHVNGTSCSTPRVAGALALVQQKFPNLNAAERKTVLLHSADDLGAPGVDPVFGHGLLNVTSALSPMGNIN